MLDTVHHVHRRSPATSPVVTPTSTSASTPSPASSPDTPGRRRPSSAAYNNNLDLGLAFKNHYQQQQFLSGSVGASSQCHMTVSYTHLTLPTKRIV